MILCNGCTSEELPTATTMGFAALIGSREMNINALYVAGKIHETTYERIEPACRLINRLGFILSPFTQHGRSLNAICSSCATRSNPRLKNAMRDVRVSPCRNGTSVLSSSTVLFARQSSASVTDLEDSDGSESGESSGKMGSAKKPFDQNASWKTVDLKKDLQDPNIRAIYEQYGYPYPKVDDETRKKELEIYQLPESMPSKVKMSLPLTREREQLRFALISPVEDVSKTRRVRKDAFLMVIRPLACAIPDDPKASALLKCSYTCHILPSKTSISKRAVKRVQAKRKLKEVARHIMPMHAVRGYEYSFYLQNEILLMELVDIASQLVAALRSANLYKEELSPQELYRPFYSKTTLNRWFGKPPSRQEIPLKRRYKQVAKAVQSLTAQGGANISTSRYGVSRKKPRKKCKPGNTATDGKDGDTTSDSDSKDSKSN